MLHYKLFHVVLFLAISFNKVNSIRAHCSSEHKINKADDDASDEDDCADGFYNCCIDQFTRCCPHATVNYQFYVWISVISSISLCLFVTIMSCYWCSCCPMYKRRIRIQNSRSEQDNVRVAVLGPGLGRATQPRPPPLQPLPTHGGVASRPTIPYPHSPSNQTHAAVPGERGGEAPAYTPYPPISNLNEATQRPKDNFIPCAPPIYPDEPPPRYTP